MPSDREQIPETTIFPSTEESREFSERTLERIEQGRHSDMQRPREIVSEELVREFERAGVDVSPLNVPWEHTQEEHDHVQYLVDISFQKDLPTAIREAQRDSSYPRNLDLLHDVLTGQMYEYVMRQNLNKQSAWSWGILAAAVIVAASCLLILFFILT